MRHVLYIQVLSFYLVFYAYNIIYHSHEKLEDIRKSFHFLWLWIFIWTIWLGRSQLLLRLWQTLLHFYNIWEFIPQKLFLRWVYLTIWTQPNRCLHISIVDYHWFSVIVVQFDILNISWNRMMIITWVVCIFLVYEKNVYLVFSICFYKRNCFFLVYTNNKQFQRGVAHQS